MAERKVITFWCHRCREDGKLAATRGYRSADAPDCWVAACPQCRTDLVRLANAAALDPYFRVSREVRAARRRHADSLLQLGDARFDLLHPEHKREREAKALAKDRAAWEAEQQKSSRDRKRLVL